MGTSGSYRGSGGPNWNRLRGELDQWLDTLPGVAAPSDDADDVPGEDSDVGQEPQPRPDPAVLNVLLPLRRALISGGRGAADGPSGGGGVGRPGGAEGGGRAPSGSGRSRARVGRVGGRLAVGVAAARAGNAAALAVIGLDLVELRELDPYRQAQRILEAATEEGVATTLEEDELQLAASRTAIWALTEPSAPDVDDVIRRFIAEYVYEVFLTEGGTVLRSGDRDGTAAAGAEDRVRNTIGALVRQVPVERTSLDATVLAGAVEQVLDQAMRIHRTDP